MVEYHVEVITGGEEWMTEQFWLIDHHGNAHRGIIPSELGTLLARPGQHILDTMQAAYPSGTFYKLDLAPGEYFPRMARPATTKADSSPGTNPDRSKSVVNAQTTSTGQLHALIQELQAICRVVHPAEENFGAYGHEIRNLLIIACTEVESHWKNILKANGVNASDRHEYVKLASAMRLGEFKVSLPWYPWLEPLTPFLGWCAVPKREKQHLPWYEDYNAVKHDRENAFAKATLINAFQATAACFVMLCAQFGWDFARRGEATGDIFFQLLEAPKWKPEEIYVPPLGTSYKPRAYVFT